MSEPLIIRKRAAPPEDWVPPLGITPWVDAEHEARFIEAIRASRADAREAWNSAMRRLIEDFAGFLVEHAVRRETTKRKRALRAAGRSVTGFRRGRRPRM